MSSPTSTWTFGTTYGHWRDSKNSKTYPQSVHRHRRSLYSWSWLLTRAFRTMPTHPNAWQITLWNQICRVPLCSSPFNQNMGRNIIQISSRHSWLWVRSILTLSERREAILAGCHGPELCLFWLENHSFQAMNRFGSNEKENRDILVQKAFPITFISIKKLSVWFDSPTGSETKLVDGKGSVLRFEILMNFTTQGHTGGLHLPSFASLYLTKCQESCFKASWSTFVKERMSHNDFKGQSC